MKLRTLQSNLDVDQLRGVEGDASADYFGVFNDLITPHAGRGLKRLRQWRRVVFFAWRPGGGMKLIGYRQKLLIIQAAGLCGGRLREVDCSDWGELF
jgi:hypothetical protein